MSRLLRTKFLVARLLLAGLLSCAALPAQADVIILQDDFTALQSASSNGSVRVDLSPVSVAVTGGFRSGYLDEDSTTAASFSQNTLDSTVNKNITFHLEYLLTSSQSIDPASTTLELQGQGNLDGTAALSRMRFWAYSGVGFINATRWDFPIASGAIGDFVFSLGSTPSGVLGSGVNWNDVTKITATMTVNRGTNPTADFGYVFESMTVSAVPESDAFLFLLSTMVAIGVIRGTSAWRTSRQATQRPVEA